MQFCDWFRHRSGKNSMTAFRFFCFRCLIFIVLGAIAAGIAYMLMLRGVFTPLGARIRGLFLEAQKTGNPLVDSVAEHQPSSPRAYEMYLHKARFLAVAGI